MKLCNLFPQFGSENLTHEVGFLFLTTELEFGQDFDTKVVLWKGDGSTGWAKWFANFVEELEIGEGFVIGASDTNEGSEDDVGYKSYFYDGSGRGQGDGSGDDR